MYKLTYLLKCYQGQTAVKLKIRLAADLSQVEPPHSSPNYVGQDDSREDEGYGKAKEKKIHAQDSETMWLTVADLISA